MPQIKSTFARLSPLDAAQLSSFSQRLPRLDFELGEGSKVLHVDRGRGERLNIGVVTRRSREVRRFNDSEQKMVSEPVAFDRELDFSIDFAAGLAETTGSRRDFSTLVELLQRAGGSKQIEALPLVIDLYTWAREFIKRYESAQLGQLVLGELFVDNRYLGKYSAKSMDNRVDLKFLEEKAGVLKSLRLTLFSEGARRTVEVRADGVLSVTSTDEDDAEHFAGEMRTLLLEHSVDQ